MNKKKVDSILKGITAAGIAMGGVSSIQGADMVMAAINESAADSNSLVDAGSLSESERTEYSESTTQSISESASESTSESVSVSESTSDSSSASESAKQSDAVQGSESVRQYTTFNKTVEVKDVMAADISNIDEEVGYGINSIADENSEATEYTSLEDVKNDFVHNPNYIVYEMKNSDIVVYSKTDNTYTAYYMGKGNVNSNKLTQKDIVKNDDGSLKEVKYSYYIDQNGVRQSQDSIGKDVNTSGQTLLFIDGKLVKYDNGSWVQIQVKVGNEWRR